MPGRRRPDAADGATRPGRTAAPQAAGCTYGTGHWRTPVGRADTCDEGRVTEGCGEGRG